MTATVRLAAPAPTRSNDDADASPQSPAQRRQHELCEAYAAWRARCRLWGPPPLASGTLGKLQRQSFRPAVAGGPDAPCSSFLAALHVAVIAQPAEALDRRVFDLYYVYRVRNVKVAAASVGVSRQHWYRLLDAFRTRVCAAAGEIEAENLRMHAAPGAAQ